MKMMNYKECSGKAKVQSRQIEGFEREMDGLQDQAFAVTREILNKSAFRLFDNVLFKNPFLLNTTEIIRTEIKK